MNKYIGTLNLHGHLFYTIAVMLFLTWSCTKDEPDYNGECRSIHFNDGWYENGKEDIGTHIKTYYIEDNCLFIEVQFGGGCKEHNIQMAANGWIKTNPVQVDARLIHDNQDLCDALITEVISFDLLSIRYGDSPKIVVNLKGQDEQIKHTYTD